MNNSKVKKKKISRRQKDKNNKSSFELDRNCAKDQILNINIADYLPLNEMYLLPILIFAILSLLNLSSGKVVTASIPYRKFSNEGNNIYFTKFSMDQGIGSYKSRAKFSKHLLQSNGQKTTYLRTTVILDTKWEEYQSLKTCEEKLKAVRLSDHYEVPNDGESWSEYITFPISQYSRRYTYFFTIMDCDNHLQGKAPAGLKILLEGELLNVGQSHFSSEEQGFLIPFFILLIGCSIFLAKNIQKFIRQCKKEEETDWAFFLSNLALLFQTLSLLFEWLHMLKYSSDGQGSFILQLIGQLCGITSQFIMAAIFILVSWGWTINYHQLENYDIYVPLLFFLGAAHIMIMGLSRLTDNQSDKYHQYSGYAGWAVVFFRLGMFVYFLFGIRDTLKTAREKIKLFIMRFTLFGTAFFLAFPVILLISSFIADYVQHRIVTIGTLTIQSIAIVIMSHLFTSTSSDYYSASMKSNPLLPTGKDD